MAHLQYMPGDPHLVDQLVYELKSKGIFDQVSLSNCFIHVINFTDWLTFDKVQKPDKSFNSS